jgi:aspartyl-tRNA(Asn)/glutamyl-tRNA(Gln) amidotransferase subunit A
VQRRIILGTYALSAGYYDAYYGKASQIRTLIKNDFKTAFASCDAILSPRWRPHRPIPSVQPLTIR